jgi:predicted nucleic acid-binding protein
MSVKTFVDTSILTYAHDLDAKEKHIAAKELLDELWTNRTGVISTQVLQEFYVNVTRRLAKPLSKKVARTIVNTYVIWCVDITPAEIAAAFRIEDEARIGFWDALVCAAAINSGAERILSEDLNPGQRITGVRIENPFLRSRR